MPEDAQRIGGEHLRAAGLAGEVEALFPLRPVHLDDWADAQPDAWPALPVRELYAPAEIWPLVIGSRMESSAQALVIRGPDLPLRTRLLLGGFGPIFSSAPLSTAFVPRSAAPAVRPGMPAAQFTSLPGTHFEGRMLRSPDFRRLLRPHVPPIVRRFIVIFCSSEDLAPAERVARLIHGHLDAAGRAVDCHVVRRGAAWGTLPRIQLGAWRLAALLLARSIAAGRKGVPTGLVAWLVRRLVAWLVTPLLGHDGATELDVVVWEGTAGAVPPSVASLAVDRFTAVRPAGAGALDANSVPRAHDAGEIRLARGDSTEAVAEVVARKVLAHEVTPLARVAPGAPPDAEPEARPTATAPANVMTATETDRDVATLVRELRGDGPDPNAPAEKPVLFVSCDLIEATRYVYPALVRGLQVRLPGLEVIGSLDFLDPVQRARVETILARAVATLVVVSRDGVREGYPSEEIALALEGGGRVIPVLLDGARMPSEDELRLAIRPLARRNALAFDALRGGPEALTRFVGQVAEVLGDDGEAPAPARDPARLRIYLCSHGGDRPRHTYRLRQDLADRFGPDSTHTDLSALVLPDSASDRETLPEGALAHADAIVLVMGPGFATLLREIPQEPDVLVPFRKTLQAALTMGSRLVPVLVDDATMPRSDDLPEELRTLPRLQAVRVREDSWAEDVTRLGDLIERAVGRPRVENDPA